LQKGDSPVDELAAVMDTVFEPEDERLPFVITAKES
jgi:hypothetical protein